MEAGRSRRTAPRAKAAREASTSRSRRSARPTTKTSTNSGDIDLVQVADANGLYANSLIAGAPVHDFTISVRVKGLENSLPTDPPVVLRNSNQNARRTGLVDCGQGNGANADKAAIVNGCPLGVYIWPEGTQCVLPNADPIDCVTAIPGNRRQKIASAIKDRINGGCNYWNAYRDSGSFNINNYITSDDPRVLPLIITEPADLAGNSNGPRRSLSGRSPPST